MTQMRKANQTALDPAFQIALLKITTKALMNSLSTEQLRKLAAFILLNEKQQLGA